MRVSATPMVLLTGVLWVVVTVGMGALYLVAKGLVPPLQSPDRAIFVFADHAGLHAQLFVYAAVLAAAMSTSSLFLSLSSGIISRDLPSALGLGMSIERQMKVPRITVAATVAVTIAVSLLTSGATGAELDKRVEAVIDL